MPKDYVTRAKRNYQKKCITKTVQFTPNERDIAEHALAQPTFSGYVKRLIREDMERTNAQR